MKLIENSTTTRRVSSKYRTNKEIKKTFNEEKLKLAVEKEFSIVLIHERVLLIREMTKIILNLGLLINFSEGTRLVKYKKITIMPPKNTKIRAMLSQLELIVPMKTLIVAEERTKVKAITRG